MDSECSISFLVIVECKLGQLCAPALNAGNWGKMSIFGLVTFSKGKFCARSPQRLSCLLEKTVLGQGKHEYICSVPCVILSIYEK